MGTDGRKMSKSWGNAIWLTDTPFEMYRKVMAINDDQIKNYFVLGTNLPTAEIPNDTDITNDPLAVKKNLAKIIVTELHSKEDAEKSQLEFERVVQNKEMPENLAEIHVLEDVIIDDEFLVEKGLANSISEAKRLFEQNAVSLDGQKIRRGEGIAGEKNEKIVLRVGKKMIILNVD